MEGARWQAANTEPVTPDGKPDIEASAALRRIYELPTSGQLFVYTALAEYLGAELAPESPRDLAIGRRGQALEALTRVAAHHGLAEGARQPQRKSSRPRQCSLVRETRRFGSRRMAALLEPVTGL